MTNLEIKSNSKKEKINIYNSVDFKSMRKAGLLAAQTLDYITSYKTSRLPQNLVQAMRDCFGSHTYERVDKSGSFHTEWIQSVN